MESASSLILIAAAALVLPLVAGRLRVPAVVLEIVFGVAIGDSALHLIGASELLDQLALLGFFLLMFLSGFEIDLGAVEEQGPGRVITALIIFVLTLGTAYVAARVLGYGFFMMFVLATTSVGIVVPTLRDTRRMTTLLGQSILLSAIFADFLTLVGVTFFAVLREHGAGPRLLSVPVFFAVVALATLALHRFAWWHPERVERFFRRDDPNELGIRAALALMLVFVGVAELFGIEAVLGAFLSGAVFAYVFRDPGPLEEKLAGFSYGFFIPIFFINVGMSLDAAVLLQPSVLVRDLAPLIVAAALVKMVPVSVLLFRGLSPRETLAAGTLLSARLSLIIAVADLGVRLGVLDRTLESVVVALAVVSALSAPTIFRALAPPRPLPAAARETSPPTR